MARDEEQEEAGSNEVVDTRDYGSSIPKITPDDLEGDTAIVTVARVESREFDSGKALVLYFDEFGEDLALVVSAKGDVQSLVDRLGNRTGQWVGERVPIEKAVRKFGSKSFEKVVVVPADEWDGILQPMPPRKTQSAGRGKAKQAKRRR